MKILHTVEFYWPSVGGSQEVVRQLSERLVKLGHDVTVATTKLPDRTSLSHNSVTIKEFDISGNAVRGYNGDTESYKTWLRESQFDVIMNYAAQQWATDLFFDVFDEVKGGKVFVPCGFSGLFDPNYKVYFKLMPNRLKRYASTVYLSEDYRDINFAREHEVKNTHIIPNGAGADEFDHPPDIDIRKELGVPATNYLVLSVGSHTSLKGHAEAIRILKQTSARDITLLIVANKFGSGCAKDCSRAQLKFRLNPRLRLAGKQLIVTGLTRPETVAAYHSADLFLFPSNIEASPLVLFEAMAAGIPFLATDVGNSREIIAWSGGGMIMPTTKDAQGNSHADIVESASLLAQFQEGKIGANLGKRGHETWRKRFSWEQITKAYEQLYKEALQ
jgi:glycosyltransferase involved in cell wall biosynthesis